MSEDKPANVVEFKSAAPSARMKQFDDLPELNKRRFCGHKHVVVWGTEPIIECADCGGVVDPYKWIRDRCADWREMEAAISYKIQAAKEELEGLRAAVRMLRGEYKDEMEKARACRELFVRPPRRSF